ADVDNGERLTAVLHACLYTRMTNFLSDRPCGDCPLVCDEPAGASPSQSGMTVEPDARDCGCRAGQLTSGQSEAAIPISRLDVPQRDAHRNGGSNEGGHESFRKRVGAKRASDAGANSRQRNAEAFRVGKIDPGS